jgi:hypothetical protein
MGIRLSIVLLWILNLWDALATWYAVRVAMYAHELNPSMAWAIEAGPLAFFGIKIVAAVVVYAIVGAWHLYGFFIWR